MILRRQISMQFQPTLPSRGATIKCAGLDNLSQISTHAPLAGSDIFRRDSLMSVQHFNPRSPRGERPHETLIPLLRFLFQPTLPSRGATSPSGTCRGISRDFNPRSPRGERQGHNLFPCNRCRISTHAPLAGSDIWSAFELSLNIFISTHAPLAGSDDESIRLDFYTKNFNPRSPRGERHQEFDPWKDQLEISTHAPLAGSDSSGTTPMSTRFTFQPTLPSRGATDVCSGICR